MKKIKTVKAPAKKPMMSKKEMVMKADKKVDRQMDKMEKSKGGSKSKVEKRMKKLMYG